MELDETPLIADGIRSVTRLLPATWRLRTEAPRDAVASHADAIAALSAPDGSTVRFAIAARRARSTRSVEMVARILLTQAGTGLPTILVSDYLSPAIRTTLTEANINFADATGWVRIVTENPLIVLTGQGAPTSPWPSRPGAVLRFDGVASNRIMRTLATADLPAGVRELAALAGTSPGSVSKSLATLASEGLVTRNDDGAVTSVQLRALMERWVQDYAFSKSNREFTWCLAPRGTENVMQRLSGAQQPVVLTGSAAARALLPAGMTPVLPLRTLAMYAAQPQDLIQELGLMKTDASTANVALAKPQDASILRIDVPRPALAPTPLVIADLLTLPGRGDAEASQLMDALASTDPRWTA